MNSILEPVLQMKLKLFWSLSLFLFVCKPVYHDLSKCHDWPVKKAIVDLPIMMKRN